MKCLCALAASLLALALTPAHSQTYPTRPIKLVNDFADLGGEALPPTVLAVFLSEATRQFARQISG